MKLCRFEHAGIIEWGKVEDNRITVLKSDPFVTEEIELSERGFQLDEVRLLAPCEPTKVVCVGVNYLEHAAEFDSKVNPEPIIFLKPVSALIGPEDTIELPKMSENVHYEGELAVVIGRRCKDVTAGEAAAFVLGYTCANDVTARDLQRVDGQWTRAKGFDTFLPVGPFLETNPGLERGLSIKTLVNGEVRQDGDTNDMRHSPAELVSFISRVMTLMPGDLILTGTPEGVGPIISEDTVTVAIEGIGALRNFVK